ncbi:MAG: DUF4231 domain-containing protein [Pseudomonadota bacterium]|nr:DUF4231 domain-containing protein [Pseudomonadota bacterium]
MSASSSEIKQTGKNAPTLPVKNLRFNNGYSATAVTVAPRTDPQKIIDALSLKEQLNSIEAIFMVSGGAGAFQDLEKTAQLQLQQLLNRSIVRVAHEIKAGFITGGTDSGIMAMLGQTVAERNYHLPLIGIAPAGLVSLPEEPDPSATPLEPHHSHFVLVQADQWGQETDTMYVFAAALLEKKPILTVLINGGEISKREILHSVRLGISIIVIVGSGRLADEIAQYKYNPEAIEDPILAEIIAEGKIHLFSLKSDLIELTRLIHRSYQQMQGDSLLKVAWRQFATYDLNAGRQQRNFSRLQISILTLGVVATALVVFENSKEIQDIIGNFPTFKALFNAIFEYLIILIPITTTGLLAAANRFNSGIKWLHLRAGAETVKSEIFRYRAQAEIYNPKLLTETNREIQFAHNLKEISQQLIQTEVNSSALYSYPADKPIPPYQGTTDDGLSWLTPEKYIVERLENQLNYYLSKAKRLDKRLRRMQWLIYLLGGIGTLLAAIKQELWIALTTATVTALTTYLEYQQIENTLIKYNQAANDLSNVRTWWIALSEDEQAKQKNIDILVGRTEAILQLEFRGWMKEMQQVFTELKEKQSEEGDSKEKSTQEVKTEEKNKASELL